MSSKRAIWTALMIWAIAAPRLTLAAAQEDGLQVVELGADIFAVLQPIENRFNQSNSLFAIGEKGVLVVDTQSTLDATREVIAEIRRRTELPVARLVLTHWHGDHVQGIAAYREEWPEVEVIGHRSLDEDVPGRARPQLEEDIDRYTTAIADGQERHQNRVDREGAPLDEEGVRDLSKRIERAEETLAGMSSLPQPFALPNLRYDGEMGWGKGDQEIRIFHYRAHTRGDTLVYFPAQGVLVTGDVVDDLPFGGHGYPTSWLQTLDDLLELEIKSIVPGHGRVRRGKEHLRGLREMFKALLEETQRAVADELDLEAARARILDALAPFHEKLAGTDEVAARAWDAFIPATIERAWAEARGDTID